MKNQLVRAVSIASVSSVIALVSLFVTPHVFSTQNHNEWGDWSSCVPNAQCGTTQGTKTRTCISVNGHGNDECSPVGKTDTDSCTVQYQACATPTPTPKQDQCDWDHRYDKDCITPTPKNTPCVTQTPTPTPTVVLTETPTPEVTEAPAAPQGNGYGLPGDGLSDGRSDGLSSCPSCTQAPQGQVLGATTEFAGTGVADDILMNVIGAVGGISTAAGLILKKRSK